MRLTDTNVAEIVKAVRSVAEPSAIILYGSYGRGDANERSDLDLLVVRHDEFRKGESRREELGRLYRAVSETCNIPKDIVLFTRREFDDWRNTTNHMAAEASREGRVLYGEV